MFINFDLQQLTGRKTVGHDSFLAGLFDNSEQKTEDGGRVQTPRGADRLLQLAI